MSSSKKLHKLVFVISRFPYPLEKGDKLRAYYQIRELSKSNEIHLITLSDCAVSNQNKAELERYCQSVTIHRLSKFSIFVNLLFAFLGSKPLQVGYFYNYFIARKVKKQLALLEPDLIITQLIRATEYTKNYHHCTKTLDYMDALSKGIERRIEKAPIYKRWIFKLEARRAKNYERIIFDYYDIKTIISEQDKKFIFHPDRGKIRCVANGIDEHFFQFPPIKSPQFDIGFVGNMSYPPNIEAVHFIANEILTQLPNLRFSISGATPHPSIQKLTKQNTNIKLIGWVDDIRTSYADLKIFIAPMMIGTGMQNKLLEAMAIGIPCITTELANNAINAIHNESIIVANTKDEMILAINTLLNDSDFSKTIGKNGRDFVRINYSWEKSTQQLLACDIAKP